MLMIASRRIKVGKLKANKVCLIELVADLGNWKSISLGICEDPLRSLIEPTPEWSDLKKGSLVKLFIDPFPPLVEDGLWEH